jgi:signal transduction histidine kinase
MLDKDNIISVLRELRSFRNLSDLDLLKIHDIVECRSLHPGECLFEEGQESSELQVLLSGDVEIKIRGVLFSVFKVSRGTLLGESSFFNKKPYVATPTALTKVEVLTINNETLRNLMEENPAFGLKVHRNFILESLSKYNELIDQVIDLVVEDPSKRVAHDIRSPLAALKVISSDLPVNDSDQKKLLNHVIDRMDRIANTLLPISLNVTDKSRDNAHSLEEIAVPVIAEMINNIVSEKRIQHCSASPIKDLSFTLKTNSESCYAKINPSAFERIISNLIDNSFEAIETSGRVEIVLDLTLTSMTIQIKDSGAGISNDLLQQLGKLQITFGKKNGSGIGLFSAYQEVESWGGTIQIESTVRLGTEITISLPKLERLNIFQ